MKKLKQLWNAIKKFLGQDDGLNPSPVPPIVNPEPSAPTEPTTPGGRFGALANLFIGDHGIDISHHNSSVNLTKVKEKQKFVIMKATEGGSFLSKVYKERIVEATKLGIPCGPYRDWETVSQSRYGALRGIANANLKRGKGNKFALTDKIVFLLRQKNHRYI